MEICTEITINNAQLCTPEVNNDAAKASFWLNKCENACLHFKKEDDNFVPSHVTFDIHTKNEGLKISIEVAENGYIVKETGQTKIFTSYYDVGVYVEKISTIISSYEQEYDPEMHTFSNLDSVIDTIQNQ